MASIDTSLMPEATGAAAELAARHADEHALKLYGGWFCPFVQRAWITLCEKGIPHQYIEINPYHKDPTFLALNPRGLVPTLAVPANKSGTELRPLYESSVICEYLEDAYPKDAGFGRALLPVDAYERARARLWIDHISTRIIPSFYKFLQHTPEKPFSIREARQEFHERIRRLVHEMDAVGPWFLGEEMSLVDISLAPWAKRLFLLDHYKPGGLGIPEGKGAEGDDEVWARWRTWLKAVEERQSVRDTWSEDERYIEAYKRYAEDKTNSLVGQATRNGTRLP